MIAVSSIAKEPIDYEFDVVAKHARLIFISFNELLGFGLSEWANL